MAEEMPGTASFKMRWTLDDIRWQSFDPSRVDPRLLEVVKAAALVEANSADYVDYLHKIFEHDQTFCEVASHWGVEEAQHGEALGRWAEMADPDFNFKDALHRFRNAYQLPTDVEESVRGSLAGELIARQVVESGTSSFYSAIRDAADEPVLKEIAAKIASDEYFHYRLFNRFFKKYNADGNLSTLRRLQIAVTRVQEAEDDELACAYYAANIEAKNDGTAFDSRDMALAYWQRVTSLYRREHIDNATRMILRAADLKPHGRLGDFASAVFWRFVVWRRDRLANAA
ncbi:MAG: ferritin-like domain-containing protein [Pseudomonadota bacterium]